MKKIIPHLWFDKEAKEAAGFYAAAFPDSQVTNVSTIHDTPSGDCDIVSFTLAGHAFMAISAGPLFKCNPSISFFVNFDPSKDPQAREHLDQLWEKLSSGGKALMPLQQYPFSAHYGWVQDRFGVSWQLMLTDPKGEERPFIVPSLMFVGANAGKAEEAIEFYRSVFKNARRGTTARYPAGMEPDKEGTIMFADFLLEGSWFAAMDSARKHDFTFTEAISFIVDCTDQEDVDYYWNALTADGGSEGVCGWLKDRYGLSWQIVPHQFGDLMNDPDSAKVRRVTQAMLQMKKFDIAALQRAAES